MLLLTSAGRRFTPGKNAKCRAWLRADRGFDPGQADNAIAPNWRSQVAGGADCAQTNPLKAPIWHASGGLNNRPYLSFNGTQAYTWASDISGSETIFMVFRITTLPGGATPIYTLYSPKKSPDNTFCEYVVINAGGYKTTSFRFDYQAAGASVGYDAALGTTNGHAVITTYNGGLNTSLGSYADTLDGSAQTMAASSTFGRTPTDLGSIGARLTSTQVISNGSICEMYEIARYSPQLTASEYLPLVSYARSHYRTP